MYLRRASTSVAQILLFIYGWSLCNHRSWVISSSKADQLWQRTFYYTWSMPTSKLVGRDQGGIALNKPFSIQMEPDVLLTIVYHASMFSDAALQGKYCRCNQGNAFTIKGFCNWKTKTIQWCIKPWNFVHAPEFGCGPSNVFCRGLQLKILC